MLDWLTCALLGGEHVETECRVWQSKVAVVFLSKEYMKNFFGKGESQVRHEMQAAQKPKQKVAIIFCFLDNDEKTLAALDDWARTDDVLAEILSRAQIRPAMYLKFEEGCDQLATKEKLYSEVVCKFRKEQFCIYDYHVDQSDYERIKKIGEVLVEKDPGHQGELIILTDSTRRGTGNAKQLSSGDLTPRGMKPSERFRTEAKEKLARAKVVITFITEGMDKKMAEAQAVDRGAREINPIDVTAMQLVELRRQVRENNVPSGGGCIHRAECCVAAVLGSDDLFKWAESEELKLWTDKRTKYGVGTRLFHFPPSMTEKDHKRVAEDMASVLCKINNSLYTTDCFLSHDWKTAGNHDKVKKMHEFFKKSGVVSWIDEEGMKGSLNQAMSSGIAGTKIFIVFLTPEYQTKVNANVASDNVFKEFSIASMKRDALANKDLSFLFVSMDPSMDDPTVWAKGLLKSTYEKKKASGEVAHIIKYKKNTAELQNETLDAVSVILQMPENRRASWVSKILSQRISSKRSSPDLIQQDVGLCPMESSEDPTPNPLQFSGEVELGPTSLGLGFAVAGGGERPKPEK